MASRNWHRRERKTEKVFLSINNLNIKTSIFIEYATVRWIEKLIRFDVVKLSDFVVKSIKELKYGTIYKVKWESGEFEAMLLMKGLS